MLSENRHWVLTRRPHGIPQPDDFMILPAPIPHAKDNEVVLRNRYLAMDPAIRNVLGQGGLYAAPLPIGTPVRGIVLGEVVESACPDLAIGDLVWGFGTWSDFSLATAAGLVRVQGDVCELPDHLHRHGTIGLTAAYGLLDIASLLPGDRVLITGAAGAVGSLAGQIAKAGGASQVVGIAGGAVKCARAVSRYGYDACLDYKRTPDLGPALDSALPDGIDIIFDNVGGPLLESAVDRIRKNARIALCGMISGYGADRRIPGPANLWNLVAQTAQMRGFRVTDILADHIRTAELQDHIGAWIAAGHFVADFDIRQGFDAVPASFSDLFDGSNNGRLLVRLD
ncbi:MAG: NADP-dependent oxidoreductase [Sphingorhabdus sp.]